MREELFISESTTDSEEINQVPKTSVDYAWRLIKIIGKKETITQLMTVYFKEIYFSLEVFRQPFAKNRLFLTELGMYHQLQGKSCN